jgi:polysaccharide chain length determinant protein (PEP-CTERM system associated)
MDRDPMLHSEEPSPRHLEPELVIQVWRRRKWLALVVFGAVLAGAISATMALPNLYRATAKVLVDNQGEVSESFVRPSVTSQLETRIQLIHQQITSRSRLDGLIKNLGLYPELVPTWPIEAVVERMRKDIDLRLEGVQAGGRNATIAFTISYSGRDPATTADVANRLAAFYVEENMRSREQQAQRTADFLARQVEGLRTELEQQESRTTDFVRRHNGELPQQLEVNMSALSRLSSRLQANGDHQMRVIERRERLEQEIATDNLAAGVVSDESLDQVQLAKLKQELVTLRGKFNDQYPDVVRLRREIAALEGQVAAKGSNTAAPASSKADGESSAKFSAFDAELRDLRQEETALRQQIAAYEARVASTPSRQREIDQIAQGRDTTRARYESLMKQYEDARIAANLEKGQSGGEFRILDAAVPPRVPTAPNRLWLVLIGCVIAVASAIAAIVAAEKLDNTYRTPDELRASLSMPVLATIPRMASDTGDRRRRTLLTGAAMAGLALIVIGSWFMASGNEAITRLMVRGGV